MANEIRADYEQLEALAQRFNKEAQDVQQVIQRVQASMEKLSDSWEGRGSRAFFREMRGVVLPASRRLYQALAQASRTTMQMAQTIKQAEQEAGALFRF